jgi:hypothetical protein
MACQDRDCDQSIPLQYRYRQLMVLEEQREKVISAIEIRRETSKRNFVQKVTLKEFVKEFCSKSINASKVRSFMDQTLSHR